MDALIIINELNRGGSRILPPPNGSVLPPPYYDASGDKSISPLDALRIINTLNSRGTSGGNGTLSGGGGSGGEGEAEGERDSDSVMAVGPAFELIHAPSVLGTPMVPWTGMPPTGWATVAGRSTKLAWRIEETLDLIADDVVARGRRVADLPT
jgi:hypothetical protein